jgi:hypothetical protein
MTDMGGVCIGIIAGKVRCRKFDHTSRLSYSPNLPHHGWEVGYMFNYIPCSDLVKAIVWKWVRNYIQIMDDVRLDRFDYVYVDMVLDWLQPAAEIQLS